MKPLPLKRRGFLFPSVFFATLHKHTNRYFHMNKAASTRLTILQKAFELIYTNGYRTTSVDDIIAQTGVTKGAFYYHFKNKDEMGMAVINEILNSENYDTFGAMLNKTGNPTKDIYNLMKYLLIDTDMMVVEYGCPVGNLTQELSTFNRDFAVALQKLADHWQQEMENAINTGKKNGLIRKEIYSKQVVYFIVSGYWGIRNFGKMEGNKNSYKIWLKELKRYLESLQ